MPRARLLLLLALTGPPLAAAAGAPPLPARAGTTYCVAPGGSDAGPGTLEAPWGTIQKAADTLGPGDTAVIRGGTYREQVVVTRSGMAGAELVFAAYPGERPVIDGAGLSLGEGLNGVFYVLQAAYVRVSGLTVRNAGPGNQHCGFLVEDSSHVVLERNVSDDTVSSGIGVWGSQNVTLDRNEVIRACHGGMQEQISVGGTSGFEVVGNRVHDAGENPIGGEGICLKDGSNGGHVHGNVVWNVPERLGIYVDAWDKHTWNIEVDGNVVHDCAEGIVLASEMGGLLESIRVTNNVCYANRVRGLTVADYGGVATHPMNDLLIVNNSFVANGTSGWGGGIAVDSREARSVVVRNNLLSANASFTIVVSTSLPAGAVTVDHNLIDGFRGDEGETRGTDYVEGDPLLVDAAAYDLHLLAGSPAIDRGSAVGAPAVDLDGVARPQGSGFDIGAFERFVSTGCAVSATALCLNGSRFRVEASYWDYAGAGGPAQAVPVTNDTGYFWFFSASNVELVIKVLDGTSINGRFWVFYGALSTLEYTITITDTLTGAVKRYQNPLGNLASMADTNAF